MASLTDVDWDEELKRQAAISALLAPPEDGQGPPLDTRTDEQVTAEPDVLKPDKSDWHKLASSVFDTRTDEQVTATSDYPATRQEDTVYPTIAQDQGQPATPANADKKFDTVTDQQVVAPAPDQLVQVEKGELVKAPDMGERGTSITPQPQVVDTPVDSKGIPLDEKPVPEPLDKGEAPAQLTQVERGQELTEPWHPAVKPNVPGFVESSKNAILNPAAGVTPPTPVDKYPDKIVTPDEAAGKTSVVDAVPQPTAAPVVTPTPEVTPTPAAATPAPTDQTVVQPSTDDWNKLYDSAFPSAADKAKAAAPSGSGTATNTDGTPLEGMLAPNGKPPTALVVHHTGGRNSPASVVEDWRTNRPGVGAQMIVDRDGTLHYTQKEFGYGGTGNFLHSVVPGVSNQTAVGVEVVAKDDADMTPAQLETLKRLAGPGGPYANVAVYGHSQVSPGDRDNEGVRGVNAINEARAAGPTAPTGEPGTTPIETLVKLDQLGLNVTHFGYEKPGEANWDKDSANGNGKYVENLIPGYDVALNSAGAALVGNPKPGETFQFAGREWRYGDAASEKLKDPRFDIFDPTGNALNGGTRLGRAGAAEPKEQSLEDLAKDWIRISPEEQAAADKQGQDSRMKILTDLQNKAPNLPAFMHALENPIQGISDADRNAKAAEIKKQLTVYAQDYYKESDPDKAYARVMAASENPVGTAAGELVSKLGPNFMHAWLSLKQQTDSPIQTRLIDFINQTHPDASPQARTALISQVMSKTGRDRVDFVNAMYDHAQAENPESVKNINMLALHDSIDVASQPGMEAKMDQYHAWVQGMVTQNLKDLREDPSLEHTALGSIANATPAMIKNIAEVAIPYIGQSAMLSEVYTDTLDGLRREHPELSEDQLKAMAASKSLPQAVLQELVNAGTMGVGGSALSSIRNPIARIITSGLAHGVVGGSAGTAQQALSNVMTGRPAGEGLQEAGTTAFIQSFLGGAWGGRHGEAEAPPPGEPTPAVPLTQDTKLPRNVVGGGAETAVPSEPTPILTPNRAARTSDVLGQEPGAPRPVSTTDVLGHQEDYAPEPETPWYRNQVTAGQDPLVIRGAERTTFTPQELSDAVSRMPNGTPEEIHAAMEQLTSPTSVHLGQQGLGEIARAKAVQTAEKTDPVQFWKTEAQRTKAEQAWVKARAVQAGEPVSVAEAIAKQRAAAKLSGTPAPAPKPAAPDFPTQAHANVYADLISRGMNKDDALNYIKNAKGVSEADILKDVQTQMRGGPPPPTFGNISGEDPHIVRESNKTTVNGVANRYVAERVAGGELPQTDPNIGVTTEELLARGAKMGPEEINKRVSDLMEGKVNNPRDMAAAVRAKERELTQRSRQLGILSEENPNDAQAKLDADNALAKLHDFHSEGGPIKKMKDIFSVSGVGLQGDLQYDLSSENGLKEKFFQESKGKKAPPQADPVIKETAARVRRAYSEDYKAKKRVSAEVDKWLGKKMNDQQIEETRQAALKKMNQVPC